MTKVDSIGSSLLGNDNHDLDANLKSALRVKRGVQGEPTTTARSRAALSTLLLLALAACGGNKGNAPATGSSGQVQETGKNPSAATSRVAHVAEQAARKIEQAQKGSYRPPEPVRFDALLTYLPSQPGWTADKPKDGTVQLEKYKVSGVACNYGKGEGDAAQSIRVVIEDGGIETVYAAFDPGAQFSSENGSYSKWITTAAGYPGVELGDTQSKSTHLIVLVADRFLVILEGKGVEIAVLRDWLGGLKLDDLARLK